MNQNKIKCRKKIHFETQTCWPN